MLRLRFHYLLAVCNFVHLKIEHHLLKLVSIVLHELDLNVAELQERIKCARFFLQWVALENGRLISERLALVTCKKFGMRVQLWVLDT